MRSHYLVHFHNKGQSQRDIIELQRGHPRWEGESAYDGGQQHASVSSQKAAGNARAEASGADGGNHLPSQFTRLCFLPAFLSVSALEPF